jgi:putative serine/threonine protein kinase
MPRPLREHPRAELSMRAEDSPSIPVNALAIERHGRVICYPMPKAEDFQQRLKELQALRIDRLEFRGPRTINNLSVLGRGKIGVVVAAYREDQKVALKMRRVDASRGTMQHEADMLKRANRISVGPRLLGVTTNFLAMEYVEGMLLPAWIEVVAGKSAKSKLRKVLVSVLEQAWRLDDAGLDHGELSHAPKHIIVNQADEPCIVDFEAASICRRASNVTSLTQYLFIGSPISTLIKKELAPIKEDNLLRMLRAYKKTGTRENLKELLRILGLTHRLSVFHQRKGEAEQVRK